jgi:hypothetical protein
VSEGATFKIEGIDVVNLDNTGTIDLAAATPAWTITGSTKNKVYSAGLPDVGATVLPAGTDATFINLLGPNEGMMVLPQTVTAGDGVDTTPKDGTPDDFTTAGKAYVVVTYGAYDQAGGVIRPSGSKAYFPLGLTMDIAKAYNFQLTLGGTGGGGATLNPISFTVDVSPWPAAVDRGI